MHSNGNFAVNIDGYLFCYFKRCSKRIRNHIFQNTGIGAATHLNFKVGSIDESRSPLTLQYLMLDGPALNGMQICLHSCHLK